MTRFAGALFAVIGLAAACSDGPSGLQVGDPFPEVVLPDLEGSRFRLSDHRGEVIVLNFWATWCPPCVEEMPSLQKLHETLGDKGLEVVAVSVDEKVEDIEAFREQHGLTFTILHDSQSEVSHSLQTFKYPETYVVDRDGNLAEKVIGALDWIAPKQIRDFLSLLDLGSPPRGG